MKQSPSALSRRCQPYEDSAHSSGKLHNNSQGTLIFTIGHQPRTSYSNTQSPERAVLSVGPTSRWAKARRNHPHQARSMFLRGMQAPLDLLTLRSSLTLYALSETPVRFSQDLIDALQASPEVPSPGMPPPETHFQERILITYDPFHLIRPIAPVPKT